METDPRRGCIGWRRPQTIPAPSSSAQSIPAAWAAPTGAAVTNRLTVRHLPFFWLEFCTYEDTIYEAKSTFVAFRPALTLLFRPGRSTRFEDD